MPHPSTSRRRLLGTGAALSVALGAPSSFAATAPDDGPAARLVAAVFAAPASAAALGRRCRTEHGGGRSGLDDPEALLAGLVGRSPTLAGALAGEDQAALAAAARALVREDFARGRTLTLGGWRIARAEAELATLAALVEDGRA